MEDGIAYRSRQFPWLVHLVAVTLLIGGGLFGGSPQQATAQQSAAGKRFNWAAPRLLPVTVEVRDKSVVLQAGGAGVALNGSLFKIDASGEVSSTWKKETVGKLNVFSLELQAQQPTLLKNVEPAMPPPHLLQPTVATRLIAASS